MRLLNQVDSSSPSDVKINFDGFVVQPSSNATVCFLLRDDVGCPIIAAARSIGKTNVSVVETMAHRDSMHKAKEKEFKKVIVKGDSSLIINCVNSKFKCPWKLIWIMKDIKSIAA
ncbi:hypothetical protein ACLB2K_046691 [Fragaria x ananassa]